MPTQEITLGCAHGLGPMDRTCVNHLGHRVVVCNGSLPYFRIIAQSEPHRRIGNAPGLVIEQSSESIALSSSLLSDAPAKCQYRSSAVTIVDLASIGVAQIRVYELPTHSRFALWVTADLTH